METHQSEGQLRATPSSSVPPTEHTLIGINHYFLLSLGREQHCIAPAPKLETAS